MMKILNFRFVLFFIAFLFGAILSAPSLLNSESGSKVSLGLDLQGGLHLMLGVKTKEAIKSKIKSIASSIKYFCEDEDILIDELRVKDFEIKFSLLDEDEKSRVDKMLAEIGGVVVDIESLNYRVSLSKEEAIATEEFAINQAVDTIRNRLDQFGLSEPAISRSGEENILVELPGIKTQEEEKRARELISRPANLQLMAVDEARVDSVDSMTQREASEYGDVILKDSDGVRKYLLSEIPILDGSLLTDAKVGFDENNQPVINFSLNSKGARIFGDFTAKNVGNRLAVVLDKKVYSAPVIRERIGGGSGQISGGFSVEEAHSVAIALRSGALLAPVVMLEKRSVGPSLGADSIKASLIALISGFIVVIVFMVLYYGVSGVIANTALIVNLFLILAVMALFGATLTLPGMAGIVLTVGMAVDANIIIQERIRELLKEGKSIQKSIEDGYKNASRAILDANITTLIVAILLYAYGTGPIKGFAITISIGILASMLTAIVGTHGVYELFSNRINKSNLRVWFGIKN